VYTLIRSIPLHKLLTLQAPAFLASFVIAEMFYKFHSFLLETGALMVTWFVLGAIVHTVGSWVLPKEPTRHGE